MQNVKLASKKVGKYVNTKHVDEVIRNYKTERWVHNSDRIGKEDSLSVWWSIDEIQSFIENAKQHGANGLKFYFGAYSNDYNEVPEYAGRQTLTMVGTKEVSTGLGYQNKDIYVQNGKETNILAYNKGTLCPPNCKPSSPGGGTTGIDSDNLGIILIDRKDKGFVVV